MHLVERSASTRSVGSALSAAAVGLAFLLSVLPVAGAQPVTPAATPLSGSEVQVLPPAWLEFGPEGTLIARVLTEKACPQITIDDRDTVMVPRAEPSETFSVIACEATIPFGASIATIGDQTLPLPDGPLARIAVIGDTGCRLNDWEKSYQACNDPQAWPFAQVAASVAAWQPDLVIHVGDYLYRESPCPAEGVDCTGSPHGDNWETWSADFFAPVSPLLGVAPWLFMRGNHESCERSPDGWFAYLDTRAFQSACQQFTEPYVATLNGVSLAVIDSAEAGDTTVTPEEQSQYARQFDLLGQMAQPGSWLVTHRPVWGIVEESRGEFEVDNASYQAATGNSLNGDYALVVSGHIHVAETIAFDQSSGRPPQIISGNAGTLRDDVPTASPTAAQLGDPVIAEAETLNVFGFLTLEPDGENWIATYRDATGAPLLGCLLESPEMICGPAVPGN